MMHTACPSAPSTTLCCPGCGRGACSASYSGRAEAAALFNRAVAQIREKGYIADDELLTKLSATDIRMARDEADHRAD